MCMCWRVGVCVCVLRNVLMAWYNNARLAWARHNGVKMCCVRCVSTYSGFSLLAVIRKSVWCCVTVGQAAELYLRVGAFQQYCDVMIEAGDWNKALAIAPAVSQQYWRTLTLRYGQELLATGDEQGVRE